MCPTTYILHIELYYAVLVSRACARSSVPPSYVGQVNHILSQSLPTVHPPCMVAVYVTRTATIGVDRNAVAANSRHGGQRSLRNEDLITVLFFLPLSLSRPVLHRRKRTLVVLVAVAIRDSLTRTTRGARARSAGHEILAGHVDSCSRQVFFLSFPLVLYVS